ncbi:hypothetical protein K432DRAFT_397258 [Lepidopterella palustris CBS 459.81]|uniref:Uncharacterized protein n=1 Tax=Lepidopterella palustris CBS 459.81 TaxID=1314670 RepID=A0A8E2E147_9PEZI|nr:hypothetical protein K432DRAFT_397258 [Lepidopterella palustris CBS 459.81]
MVGSGKGFFRFWRLNAFAPQNLLYLQDQQMELDEKLSAIDLADSSNGGQIELWNLHLKRDGKSQGRGTLNGGNWAKSERIPYFLTKVCVNVCSRLPIETQTVFTRTKSLIAIATKRGIVLTSFHKTCRPVGLIASSWYIFGGYSSIAEPFSLPERRLPVMTVFTNVFAAMLSVMTKSKITRTLQQWQHIFGSYNCVYFMMKIMSRSYAAFLAVFVGDSSYGV